jgi:exopolysaccharide biosynthesis WecB/TagA/CpsF family protein
MSCLEGARQVKLGGLTITALTRAEWADLLVRDFQRSKEKPGEPRLLSSVNGNVVSLYGRDAAFRDLIESMDAVDADGMPLVHVSRLKRRGNPLPERVATTDFFHDAARAAERHGISFYLLGGEAAENARAAQAVRQRYPGLRIAGARHGYFAPGGESDVVADVKRSGTDVLWVGLGVPREQAFMVRNRSRLDGLTWVKSCGGLFNFLSGTRRRAPIWMQRAGLEWSYRLAQEPRRLAVRYAVTNVHALYRMLVVP